MRWVTCESLQKVFPNLYFVAPYYLDKISSDLSMFYIRGFALSLFNCSSLCLWRGWSDCTICHLEKIDDLKAIKDGELIVKNFVLPIHLWLSC